MTDTIKKQIVSFIDLQDGWHFGEGVGASDTAVKAAHDVYDLMIKNGAEEIEAFPAIDGGILISGYFDNESLDVSCRPDGTMEIDHEVNNVLKNEKQGLRLNNVRTYLEKLNWNKKKSLFGYYIPGISAGESNDIQVRLSNLPAMVLESPPLAPNVLLKVTETNANISMNITEESLLTPTYFGESNPELCRTIAYWLKSHQKQAINVTAISQGYQEESART
ncbi:MAG: hypothetical protein OXF60_10645 [Gammaproteobacteria bacterium]|nr:hypothetical protein [Gammaproteobacteria bacterium]